MLLLIRLEIIQAVEFPFQLLKKVIIRYHCLTDFVNIKPAYLTNVYPKLPQPGTPLTPKVTDVTAEAKRVERTWLEYTESVFRDASEPQTALGWAAFHA